MVKLSRSAFISMLATTGAYVLTGCGAGTPKNSNYAGSYRSAYTISQLNESGTFNFTVDVKGRVQGTLDNQSGKVREFSGEIQNNGELTGDTYDRVANVRGQLNGKVAGTGTGTGNGNIGGGNFTLVENNTPTTGNFTVGVTPDPPGSSGYQGFYNGIYKVPELSQNGSTSFTVDSQGKMTGLFTRGSETGTLTGTISSTGAFTSTVAFRSDSVTVSGSLIKTEDNSTQGNFTLTSNNKAYAGVFSAATPVTGDSPFKGSYRGTYGIPESGESGTLSFTVDPSGALLGFFSRNQNQPTGIFTGAFDQTGNFSGTVTYENASGLAPRPITGKMGTAANTGLQSGDFVMIIDGVSRPGSFEVTGGPEPDSNYRAAYTDGGLFSPAIFFGSAPIDVFESSPDLSFNIDKEGYIVGTFGPYAVSGAVKNDGRIVGKLRGADGNFYIFQGVVNKVIWTFNINGQDVSSPGISGDLIFSVKGQDYYGWIKCTGGDGTTRKH